MISSLDLFESACLFEELEKGRPHSPSLQVKQPRAAMNPVRHCASFRLHAFVSPSGYKPNLRFTMVVIGVGPAAYFPYRGFNLQWYGWEVEQSAMSLDINERE